MNIDQVILAMKSCDQVSRKQTVWEHGESVRDHLLMIYDYLTDGKALPCDWRIPPWLKEKKEQLAQILYPREVLARYALFHDLGKPYCQEKGPDG